MIRSRHNRPMEYKCVSIDWLIDWLIERGLARHHYLFIIRMLKKDFNRDRFITSRVISVHKAEVHHRSNNDSPVVYRPRSSKQVVRLCNWLLGRGQVRHSFWNRIESIFTRVIACRWSDDPQRSENGDINGEEQTHVVEPCPKNKNTDGQGGKFTDTLKVE